MVSDKSKGGGAPPAKGKKDSAATEDMSGLGKVMIRNEFYRDGYRTLLKVALLEAVVILGLIGVTLYVVHVHQPENRYFATTEDGRLMPMLPLSEPNLSAPALMSWVAQSSTEVMTFGFNDYRRRLQEASRHFTREGWETFSRALEQSRILELVEAKQQVVTAAPSGAPVIKGEGVYRGRYQWQIQLPLILTFQSGRKTLGQNLLVTMIVVRVPRLESSNGVGIQQWVATAQ